jgi:hypothetical protein
LLEVLVALAMAAALAGALYGSVHVAYRARRSAERQVQPVRAARTAISAVAGDLMSAMPPSGLLAAEFIGEQASGAGGDPADTLSFCTLGAGMPREGACDIRRIDYALIEPSGVAAISGGQRPDGMVLVRRMGGNPLASTQEDPAEQIICRNVASLQFRYFDGDQWFESWDSTVRENALPVAVEVELEVTAAGDGGRCRLLRIIAMPCVGVAEAASGEQPPAEAP